MLILLTMKCRICGNENIVKFLSLGSMPLANSFLSKEDLGKEERSFPLETCFCRKCKLVQLSYVVDPRIMFKNYIYVSSTTKTFQNHFSDMANDIVKEFLLNQKSLVVDIGSNDGVLLKPFKNLGIQTIGVEPAGNIAKIAEQNGIETINEFFNNSTINQIIEKKGNADLITATNVFAHISDINGVVENVKSLLKKGGIFVIEIQYFMDTIEKLNFDNIYHEHLYYYTLTSLVNFLKMHDMEVFDVKKVDSHGVSLRVFIKKSEDKHEIKSSVNEILSYEKEKGVEDIELYNRFAEKVYAIKEKLLNYIRDIKKQDKKIAAYGAPAKGNTLLNFCSIGNDYIDYVIEDNKLKIGLYTPGTHIQVLSPERLDNETPDYILILAWNFSKEILEKTKKYADQGVKFIVPLPEPKIV
jgi:2-polyprenyl-3-methyl-5-hydroxy-6-metoxy-1,4-benzoquinol methylase